MDLYLIHCPFFYDFRKDFLISGSEGAGVPSTSFFEMYPIGLISLADTLQKHNYKVQIVNLALKMLHRKYFDVEKFIKKLDSEIFAFDLHWMIHAQGTFEIAKLVKKYHHNSHIILGGFTASYFHREIMESYPFIDFIIRGDSTEYPLLKLVNNLKFNRSFESIPNLVWRNQKKIKINDFSHVPDDIEYNAINFPKVYFKMFLASHDIDVFSYLPTLFFLKKPVIPIMFCKGCTYNCINCGGSRYSYKIINNRTKLAKKPPKIVAEELLNISQSFNFPIRFIGDLRICGKRYYNKIFEYLGNYKIENPTTFEFFTPANKHYIKKISKHFESVSIEISPESGNQEVRMFQGRPFTNQGILDMIKKFDLFNEYILIMWFQIGNALDTEETLKETVKFSEEAIKQDPKNTHPLISSLAPYIDPGSLAFDFPEKYGYIITRNTLKKQIEGFSQPIWKYYLNYETKFLNLDQIISLNYKYAKSFEKIRFKSNIITEERFNENIRILNFLEHLNIRVDNIWREKGRQSVNDLLKRMRYDKTALKIKSKFTPELFPEIRL
ncbi:MAG: TIGR04190 family B12-binding domain/radical SAM domain protein, partial [Promethearchaeota archaeon]